MKKLTALLLALSMALALAACGAKETAPEAPAASSGATSGVTVPDASEEETPVEEETPAAPGGPSEPAGSAEEEQNTAAQAPSAPAVQPQPIPEPVPEAPVEPEPPASPIVSDSVDLSAFYTSLTQTYGENFPANMNLCDSLEMLDAFYPGLSGLETKQMMVYQPMMGAVVCEIALVETADAADVETVKGILQSRIDSQVEGGAWYPESIEGWKNNSRIVTSGNCVMMIAYSECDAVVEAFNALF